MRPAGTTRAKKPIFKKEYERLMAAAGRSQEIKGTSRTKLKNAFTLLYLTGCRVSEITNFSMRDIEHMINENEYSLTNATKTKKARLISFDEQKIQIDMLKKLNATGGGYLFAKNNSTEPMTTSSLKLMMNTFIHKVLGELYSTHSFRTGYITTAHQVGLSLEHIREDIGHANISTTARYTKVTHQEISRGKNLRVW